MTRVGATGEGVPTEQMARYYAGYARGEFGLIISEGIYPDLKYGPGYLRQPGLVTVEQVKQWRRVTDCVHGEATNTAGMSVAESDTGGLNRMRR